MRSTCLAPALLILLSASLASAQYQQAWVERYDGPESYNDYVAAVVVAPSGDVYVAGQTYEFTGSTYYPRFLTIRYDPQGNLVWSRLFHSGAANVSASASGIALDPAGDVIVVGGVNFIQDWGVVKYDAAGNELWNRVIQSNSTFLASPTDVEIDAAGNIYFIGDTNLSVPNGPNYAVTVKLAPDGSDVWTHAYSGPGGLLGGSSPSALVVDGPGNVYVAGTTKIPGLNGNQFSVFKLNAAGIYQWEHTSGSAGTVVLNRAYDLALDSAGDLVAAGIWGGNTTEGSDVAVAKYDTAGNLLWSRTWNGPDGKSDWGTCLAIDGQDAVAVGGYSGAATFGDQDAIVIEYDTNGNLLWDRRYAGGAQQADYTHAIATDASDRVILAGEVTPHGAGNHFFTAVYDSAGTLVWDDQYGGPLNGASAAWDVAVDGAGNIFVTGESSGSGTGVDVATIRYSPEEGPQAYCTAQVSSQGCLPAIGFAGAPSATAGSGFDVTATLLLNQKNGLLFYGTQGATALPFLGGTLCVAPPLRRTSIQNSGGSPPPANCTGTQSFDFNAHVAAGVDPTLIAGQGVWAQFWNRDPDDASGANLTDALSFTIGT